MKKAGPPWLEYDVGKTTVSVWAQGSSATPVSWSIRNHFQATKGMNFISVIEILQRLAIAPTRRVEMFSIEEFVRLTLALSLHRL
jgi:hypothetical protein